MRTGTHKHAFYIALTAGAALCAGVAVASFQFGTMQATDRLMMLSRTDKADRLAFPDQAKTVARAQKDNRLATFGLFARADLEAAGYDVFDRVAIDWTGPDAPEGRVIVDLMRNTTILASGAAVPAGDARVHTVAQTQEAPAAIEPANAPPEVSTNVSAEYTDTQGFATDATRWARHLWGLLFGDAADP